MDLKWDSHIEIADEKYNKIVNGLNARAITAAQKVHLLNIMATTVVEYGMMVVAYNKAQLKKLDTLNRKVVKRALGMPIGCPSDWLHGPQSSGGMGLTTLTGKQGTIFLSTMVDSILKGPDSLGKRVILSNISTHRAKNSRDLLTIKGSSETKGNRGLLTTERLINELKERKLELISERVEQLPRPYNEWMISEELTSEETSTMGTPPSPTTEQHTAEHQNNTPPHRQQDNPRNYLRSTPVQEQKTPKPNSENY